jgi:PD-(D/E)XK nuclease superfamily
MESNSDVQTEKLTYPINGCAMRVHSVLGPGLLDSAYRACLKYELEQSGLLVEQEMPLPIRYRTVVLEWKSVIGSILLSNGGSSSNSRRSNLGLRSMWHS